MTLEEILRPKREQIKEYVKENWPNRVLILLFILSLLGEDTDYAKDYIESLGEEAYEKWNDGTNYEESLHDADVRLMENLNKEVSELIAAGVAVAEASEYLSERFYSTRVHDISRIMVTETTRIEAEKVVRGGDRYIYHCVHDSRTCAECLARDGQVFLSTDATFGQNCPPMHPWCRCWLTNG